MSGNRPTKNSGRRRREPSEYGRIKQKANELYPQGYGHVKTNVLVDDVSKALGKNAPKNRYQIERALGRRKN
jgi:hypothetical protein